MKAKTRIGAVLGTAALALGAQFTPALATDAVATPEETRYVVGLGDSFMSGEGGRFAGNVYETLTYDGATDDGAHNRGWNSYVDQTGHVRSGDESDPDNPAACHRSDTSIPISLAKNLSANGHKYEAVNFACSGAETKDVNVDSFRGESPQIVQLEQFLTSLENNKPGAHVDVITLSLGGNDLHFSDILTDCMQIVERHNCGEEKQEQLVKEAAVAQQKITDTLNMITAVMRAHGYADGSYTFFYDGVPNLFASQPNRYPAKDGWADGRFHESPGVPYGDETVSWAKGWAVPYMNDMMARATAAAGNKHIQFVDMRDAFEGHSLSDTRTVQVRKPERDKSQSPTTAEWIVPLDPHFLLDKFHMRDFPRLQESFHPNAFGQQAIALRLTSLYQPSA